VKFPRAGLSASSTVELTDTETWPRIYFPQNLLLFNFKLHFTHEVIEPFDSIQLSPCYRSPSDDLSPSKPWRKPEKLSLGRFDCPFERTSGGANHGSKDPCQQSQSMLPHFRRLSLQCITLHSRQHSSPSSPNEKRKAADPDKQTLNIIYYHSLLLQRLCATLPRISLLSPRRCFGCRLI
jgi:hypothetical protein